MSRPIDAVQVLHDINSHHRPTPANEFESGFNSGLNQAMWIICHAPTLTPQNEPLTIERVAREYLEICGDDCAGDQSVGVPACPFFKDADVSGSGALIQPMCELAVYRRPPERPREMDT